MISSPEHSFALESVYSQIWELVVGLDKCSMDSLSDVDCSTVEFIQIQSPYMEDESMATDSEPKLLAVPSASLNWAESYPYDSYPQPGEPEARSDVMIVITSPAEESTLHSQPESDDWPVEVQIPLITVEPPLDGFAY